MILSGREIADLVARTRALRASGLLDLNGLHADFELIDIHPFQPERVNPNSYNLSLDHRLKVYDLRPEAAAPDELVYQTPSGDWVRALDCARDNPTVDLEIPPEGYVLEPNMLYLGATREVTETYNLVPEIAGRSSIGRLGIQVHITAGFGETFFCGHWTLEISVIHPVRVYAGMQICQLVYNTLRGRDRRDRYAGKYQNQDGPVPSRLWKEFDARRP